jgi:hypothetical protein
MVIMVYSLFSSSNLPSPHHLQGALNEYMESSSSKELVAAVEENFHKCGSLMEEDGVKLQNIVMANPFSKLHFTHATDGIFTWTQLEVAEILSKN